MTGICTFKLRFAYVKSLKEKRRLLHKIMDKIKHRFNASIAEVGAQDEWQLSFLTVALVNNDGLYIEKALAKITSIILEESEIIEYNIQLVE